MQILISPSLDEQLRQLSEEKQLRYSEIVRAALIEYIQRQNQINKEKK
jgi:predicted transcriptional regulator